MAAPDRTMTGHAGHLTVEEWLPLLYTGDRYGHGQTPSLLALLKRVWKWRRLLSFACTRTPGNTR